MMFPAKYIHVSIKRPFERVYGFISNPENMPQWATGLSRSAMIPSGDAWIADSPMGKVKVRFTEPNPYGIADHEVTLPSGEVHYNPLRVIRNAEGCDVVFTLFQTTGMSDAAFANDAGMVTHDLLTLKQLLES